MSLPEWAKAPGPDWVASTVSDDFVVWRKGNETRYQRNDRSYVEPAEPTTVPKLPIHRRVPWVSAVAGVVGAGLVELAVHIK